MQAAASRVFVVIHLLRRPRGMTAHGLPSAGGVSSSNLSHELRLVVICSQTRATREAQQLDICAHSQACEDIVWLEPRSGTDSKFQHRSCPLCITRRQQHTGTPDAQTSSTANVLDETSWPVGMLQMLCLPDDAQCAKRSTVQRGMPVVAALSGVQECPRALLQQYRNARSYLLALQLPLALTTRPWSLPCSWINRCRILLHHSCDSSPHP